MNGGGEDKKWYSHPSIRITEWMTILGTIGTLILFARAYDNRILLLEERMSIVKEQLHVMQDSPGNSLTQPSRFTIQKFEESDRRMDRMEVQLNFHRDKLVEQQNRIDEMYYGSKRTR